MLEALVLFMILHFQVVFIHLFQRLVLGVPQKNGKQIVRDFKSVPHKQCVVLFLYLPLSRSYSFTFSLFQAHTHTHRLLSRSCIISAHVKRFKFLIARTFVDAFKEIRRYKHWLIDVPFAKSTTIPAARSTISVIVERCLLYLCDAHSMHSIHSKISIISPPIGAKVKRWSSSLLDDILLSLPIVSYIAHRVTYDDDDDD